MNNLIDRVPAILENSDNLFGVFALIAIIFAVVVFLFFRNADTKQKERIFIYSMLFFLALIFSALTAGIFSGFESGSEITSAQVEQDPSLVKLLPETVEKLNTLLLSENQATTEENKAQLLETALADYINSSETPTPASQVSDSSASQPSQPIESEAHRSLSSPNSQENKGFIFELQDCRKSSENSVSCSFLITNNQQDNELKLYGDFIGYQSRIIDPNGNEHVATKVIFGDSQSRTIVDANLAQGIAVRAEIEFQGISESVEQLALIELLSFTRQDYYFTVQFRDVSVSN